MVRWAVTAQSSSVSYRDPPYSSSSQRKYYGTVVQDPSFLPYNNLPVVDVYCPDEKAPWGGNTTTPCSLLFNAREFYDNVALGRKGQSSLNWPKPKFRIDSGSQGKIFDVVPSADGGGPRVRKINFNSEWFEPGENTFMRETLAWETLRQMGVDHLTSYQTVVKLNGKYFGKFALGVDWTQDALKMNGYSTSSASPSPLFKSESGEYSNLRWDIPPDQVPYYYSQETDNVSGGEGAAQSMLVQFGIGLSGGDAYRTRSAFLFDAVLLPKTINYMAAMTLLLNQDRCTKNFEIYYDPSAQQWAMLPWDIEGSFGIDRGLGGVPAPDYCILACEQWNSPLYCDRNHPQDLMVKTPWGLITTQINPSSSITAFQGQGGRRRVLVDASSSSNAKSVGETGGTDAHGAAQPGLSLPANSSIPAEYDADQTKRGATVTGAAGTFNYLIDAILAVPRTRAMYMRRLRTLMDEFLGGSGKLQSIVATEYNKIRDEAKRDAQKWGNPGDPDRGYQQLLNEQIPIRKDQLFNTYSSGGGIPLIPSSQPSHAPLSIVAVASGTTEGYVQIYNDNDYAVDVGSWTLESGNNNKVLFTFVPGTVIPPKDYVYVAATSVGAFKSRSTSPRGREGRFVVGPLVDDAGTSMNINNIKIVSTF